MRPADVLAARGAAPTADPELLALLRDSIARYAAEHYAFAQRQRALETPSGYSEAAWKQYAEMGCSRCDCRASTAASTPMPERSEHSWRSPASTC